jgi:NAD(P)-dependent dehydrogenase (short-subunit alcohol dehydrogenase family)
MRGLDGKGVLIVGGTSGIGLATARRFLQERSRVFVAGIDETELKDTLGALQPLGTIEGIVGDVGDEGAVDAIVSAATASLGRIDVLINNAGTAHKSLFLETETEAWDRTIAVNLRGMFLVARGGGGGLGGGGEGGGGGGGGVGGGRGGGGGGGGG